MKMPRSKALIKDRRLVVPEFPKVVETFHNPSWTVGRLTDAVHREPSCFNGMVSVRKYRVTAELINEPIEVIRLRLIKLWRECDNSHHTHPIYSAGKEYGLDLDINLKGIDRKR